MQTKDRWVHGRTCVYNLGYHIIWCPKYRRKVLIDDVETKLKELLIKKAEELNCKIETMEVMPDHVHLFLKIPPTLAIHFVIQQMKGCTATNLRKEFPQLVSKLPNMWTRSYYVESVGHISQETIEKYIADQKNK